MTMDSGNDEESELDTKRNKTARNGGEKAKLGSSVAKASLCPWTACCTTEPSTTKHRFGPTGNAPTWEEKQTWDKQTDQCAPRTVPVELPGPLPCRAFQPPLNRRADTVPTAQPPGPSTEGVLRLFSGCFALAMLWHRPRGILVPPNVSPHRQPENDKADWALRMTL